MLPHTQDNSGYFEDFVNLRMTKGSFSLFLYKLKIILGFLNNLRAD